MKSFAYLGLFFLQIVVTLLAFKWLGRDIAPFLMLLASGGIVYFIFNELKNNTAENTDAPLAAWWWALLPFVCLLLLSPMFKALLHNCPEPDRLTDVIGQLNAQYNRFIHGIMPYSPVTKFSHSPFPVYMPMHWLPLGISYGLQIDLRWSGYAVFYLSSLIYGFFIIRQMPNVAHRILLSSMPAACLGSFLWLNPIDIALSLETIIAAYYLILIVGLLSRNHFLIILGLILCLLSRYTLVFWLPMFAFIYFKTYDFKRNLVLWGSMVVSVLLLYVFPFLLKDPTILAKGIAYHNECAVNLLKNAGEGVHFANFIDRNTQCEDVQTVTIIRIIQLFCMIFMNIAGIYFYRRFRNIHGLDIAALFLYSIILVFFLSSPMVFYYYYLVSFVLLGALFARLKI